MEHPILTGFTDKAGRQIYVGDLLQHRLGKFGKSGGSKQLRVIQFGKKIQVIDANQSDPKYGGVTLSDAFCKDAVVIQSEVMPNH